mgnify:CR=1 FL=1
MVITSGINNLATFIILTSGNGFVHVYNYINSSISDEIMGMFGLLLDHNIMSFLGNHLYIYSCPYNISFSWNIGFLLFSSYSLQLVTGILLALHYT